MPPAADLADALDACASLAIVCHDDPDPDSLASALALRTIADSRGVSETPILYGGEISHQQNRAFVTMLDVDVVDVDEGDVDIAEYDCVAVVDHSRAAVNSVVPAGVDPDVLVDHHPGGSLDAGFVDVRTDYGATATIFVEYLLDLDVPLSTRLASALLFAIHRERLDFLRDPTEREYRAALAVFPHADLEALERLYGSAFTRETIDAIGRAIASREQRGSALVASVGRTTETDALPQAADYLLNVEGVDTVLVYGLVDGAIRISARSIDPRIDVGETLEGAYGDLGSVGGHHDMAGGRAGLDTFAAGADEDDLLAVAAGRIARRFFDALDLDDPAEEA